MHAHSRRQLYLAILLVTLLSLFFLWHSTAGQGDAALLRVGNGIEGVTYRAIRGSISPEEWVYLPIILRGESGPSPTPTSTPPSTPAICNGDYEQGKTCWIQDSTNGFDLVINDFQGAITPHSGSWAAWLGGYENETSVIYQQITVPTDSANFSYWHWIASEDDCGYDSGGVAINEEVVDDFWLCENENTGGWVQRIVNLSAYAGQIVNLYFFADTDGELISSLFIDDVQFQDAPIFTATPTPTATIMPTPTKTDTPEVSPTPTLNVFIDEIEPDPVEDPLEEYVDIRNTSGRSVDMESWVLRDDGGNIFIFPDFTLSNNSTVRVLTGTGFNSSSQLFWGRTEEVWNDVSDCAYLRDGLGTDSELIDLHCYPPLP